jgi:protein O-GlcNAc transferase
LESGTFDRAVEHHRAGRLEAAETLYRQVLPSDARHADALHLSGVAALQLGRYDEALPLIEDAIVAKPESAAYRLSLGQVHSAKSRLQDAVAAYRQATELRPDLADAWFGLGIALQAANRQEEAIAAYRRLIVLEPDQQPE